MAGHKETPEIGSELGTFWEPSDSKVPQPEGWRAPCACGHTREHHADTETETAAGPCTYDVDHRCACKAFEGRA
jgi:hypothetical protein